MTADSQISASPSPETPASGDAGDALRRLDDVLGRLIAPDGCPWDKEQTPPSLTEYLVEECFELVDAIRSGTAADVREELGDLLFLLVFVARLHTRPGGFTLADAPTASACKAHRKG